MNIFIFISLYTTIMSFIEGSLKSHKSKKIFLIILLLPIFIISWRRGNTAVDYGNYEYLFLSSQNVPLMTGSTILGIEPGYFFINKLVSLFTSNFNMFLLLYSSIVLGIYYYFINKFSAFYGFSVILLVGFGSYYTSFNTMRQFLAATVCIVAVANIEKGFWRYSIVVLLAATFHVSALIMIPFYFLLNLKPNTLKGFSVFIFFLLLALVVLFYTPSIVKLLTSTLYQEYNSTTAFGITTSIPFSALARILFLLIYSLIFFRMIDFEKSIERVGFNSLIITLVFMLFSTRVEMFQRFTYFFLPYMIVFIPNLTAKIIDKKTRLFFIGIVFSSCLIYIFLTQRDLIFIWS